MLALKNETATMSVTYKTYSEVIAISSFLERLRYLQLQNEVGFETFGWERYLNQRFYCSPEWKRTRRDIIIRDNGCDLAMPGYEIGHRSIIIHHINPITLDNIKKRDDCLFDPENLIITTLDTHNAIHYGTVSNEDTAGVVIERHSGDTCPWK